MNETNSPRATFRFTWLNACTGPSRVSKRSDTSLISIAASGCDAAPASSLSFWIAAVSIGRPYRATARGAVNSL